MEFNYNGKTEADLWEYLDEIERQNLDFDDDTNIAEVTDAITKTSDGRNALVERYGNSGSVYVVYHVWGAIGIFTHDENKANQIDSETLGDVCRLMFEMAERVRWLTINPEILMGVFNIIKVQVWRGFWNERKFPPTLYAMLQRCLRFGWINEGKAQHMQIEVLTLLNMMCEKDIVQNNFDAEQIQWLRDEARRLATFNVESNIMTEGLNKEGMKFLNCLDKCGLTSYLIEK